MGKKDTLSRTSSEQLGIATLHKRAEEQISDLDLSASKVLTPDETQQMLHDLRVHQIELEMQNEELRRTQQELDAARERYFDLYDMAPVGYITLSEQGLILEANLTFAGLLGVGRSALVKQPLTRFILKEDQNIYYLHRKQHFENDEAQIIDLRMVKKDGTHFWAQVASSATQDMGGSTVCRTVISDITGRKQAEKSVAEAGEKYRTLFETMSEGIVYEDHDGRIISANPAAERLLGLSLDQMQGRTSLDPRWKAIHVDGSPFPGETHSLNVAAKTGKPMTGEVMGIYNPETETYVWLSVNSNPEFLPGKKEPYRAYAVFRDITERKQAEEALRESERFLASTLDGLSSHIAVIDASGEIVLTNKVYRDFAAQNGGDPRAVSEGTNYITICDAARGEGSDEAARFGEAIRRVLDGSCPSFEMEYPCNAPDRKRWFIGRVTPFQGDGPRRAVIAHEDITERKNAELEILSLSGHLLSIQEDERQRVARDLHDSVGQTVLAAKLNIEAYRKKRSDRERLGDSLAFLDRASQELRSIYTGLYPSILDDLGFEAAVRWYAKHILEANGISTSLGIALESEINHDTAVNLYRIIQEVLSNVLKHSGADSVKLEIHEKGGILMLTVQDKGIGFDEKAVGLDKFGLVSLRYRARLLGGECRIDSIIGEGTTVTVTVMRAAP